MYFRAKTTAAAETYRGGRRGYQNATDDGAREYDCCGNIRALDSRLMLFRVLYQDFLQFLIVTIFFACSEYVYSICHQIL